MGVNILLVLCGKKCANGLFIKFSGEWKDICTGSGGDGIGEADGEECDRFDIYLGFWGLYI